MEVPICASAAGLEVMLGYIWGQVGISCCVTRRADLQPIPPGSILHIVLLLRPDGILPWWIHQFHRTHAPDMCNPIRNVRARCRASGCKPITWSWLTPKCLRLTMRQPRPNNSYPSCSRSYNWWFNSISKQDLDKLLLECKLFDVTIYRALLWKWLCCDHFYFVPKTSFSFYLFPFQCQNEFKCPPKRFENA